MRPCSTALSGWKACWIRTLSITLSTLDKDVPIQEVNPLLQECARERTHPVQEKLRLPLLYVRLVY